MIYANFSDGEIEVSGDTVGLQKLAQFVRGDISGLGLEVDHTQRHPLRRIELREGDGKLSIGADGSTLVIAGTKKLFPLLAENIEFLVEDGPSESGHLHIEFVPDHFYLSERSTPVLVTKIGG